MTQLVWICLIILALALALAGSQARRRRRHKQERILAKPRRQHYLESAIAKEGFAGPSSVYGPIFTAFVVTRRGRDVQMDVDTAPLWLQLGDFTRALIIRHLWRTLARLASTDSTVVLVDYGKPHAQTWTKREDASFNDFGKHEPWKASGRTGTMISGPNQTGVA